MKKIKIVLLSLAILCFLLEPQVHILVKNTDINDIYPDSKSEISLNSTRANECKLPVWDTGYKWVYHRTSRIAVEPDGYINLVDIGDYVVDEISEVRMHDGRTELVYNLTLYNGRVSGDGHLNIDTDDPPDGEPDQNVDLEIDSSQSWIQGFMWYRVSDLALLNDYRDLHIVVNASQGILGGVVVINAQNSLQSSPGEEDYDFPLYTQDAWASSHNYHINAHYEMNLPDWMNDWGIDDESDDITSDSPVYAKYWCNNTENLNNGFDTYSGCYHVDASLDIDGGKGKMDWWFYPEAKNFARWHIENLDFAGMVIEESNMDLKSYDIWQVTTTGVSMGPNNIGIAHPGGQMQVICDFQSSEIRFDEDISGITYSTQDIEGDFVANITVPTSNDNTIMKETVPVIQYDVGSHGLLIKTGPDSFLPKTLVLRKGDILLDEDAVDLSSQTIITNESVMITAEVSNPVETFMGYEIELALYLDHGTAGENLIVTKTFYGLGFGAAGKRTVELTWDNPVSGEHTLTLMADPNDLINETYENNNMVELGTFNINSRPQALLDADLTEVLTYEMISFSANRSYDIDGDVEDYDWDMGDGTQKDGSSFQYQYADDGIYNVTLTLTDDSGLESSTYRLISVENRDPKLDFHFGNQQGTTIGIGDDVYFDASASTDMDGIISMYTWDIEGIGTFLGTNISYSFDSRGEYPATINISDDDGAKVEDSFTIIVKNKEPLIVLDISDTEAPTNTEITFDAAGTSDPDIGGEVISYQWDFGDGETDEGTQTKHTYVEDGKYSMVLTVTDNEGGIATKTVEINITNRLPVLLVKSSKGTLKKQEDNIFSVGKKVSIDATRSSDPDGEITEYWFDNGDGDLQGWGSSGKFYLEYSHEGDYTLTVRIKDNDGGITEKAFSIKTTSNLPPTCLITFSPQKPGIGQKVTFSASTDDPDGDSIVGYMWNFDIDNILNDQWVANNEVDVKFQEAGGYTVTLRVKDSKGLQSDIYTIDIAVQETASNEDSGEGSSLWLWLLIAIVAIVIVIFLIVILVRRKKADGGEEKEKSHEELGGMEEDKGVGWEEDDD